MVEQQTGRGVYMVAWTILLICLSWPLAWFVAPIWVFLLPFEIVVPPGRVSCPAVAACAMMPVLLLLICCSAPRTCCCTHPLLCAVVSLSRRTYAHAHTSTRREIQCENWISSSKS